jgi:hypothetical protein
MSVKSRTEPLNPRLYQLLTKRFHSVKISNAGEQAQIVYEINRERGNREEPVLAYPGEYYLICCPFCGDTKYRLYINHLFGQSDGEGNEFLHLAHCFNERCMTRETVREFIEDLTDNEWLLSRFKIRPGVEVDISQINMDWPGPCVRVDELKPSHKAYQFLVGRDFDPALIARGYDVRYCSESSRYYMAPGRLIIPIYEGGRMLGWQARDLQTKRKLDDPLPKYWTCPGTPKKALLYNFGRASLYQTGVIVEGPTDVWRFGPMACAALGSSMSPLQIRKFVDVFKLRSCVLLFDPEEYDKEAQEKLRNTMLSSFVGGCAAIRLPKGTDPGSLDRQVLRDFVRAEARKQGVKVSWKRL